MDPRGFEQGLVDDAEPRLRLLQNRHLTSHLHDEATVAVAFSPSSKTAGQGCGTTGMLLSRISCPSSADASKTSRVPTWVCGTV